MTVCLRYEMAGELRSRACLDVRTDASIEAFGTHQPKPACGGLVP